jgi:predicted phage-related endonuclease
MNLINKPITDRRSGLGGTDAKKIVEGDWLSVYNEKLGITEPPDLSDIFPVQLGSWTEPFHREWFAKRSGKKLIHDSLEVAMARVHPEHSFMFGHIDAWIPEDKTFLEMKHTNAHSSFREKADYYMPQMAHYAAICGVNKCWFSMIPGNGEPIWGEIEITTDYMNALIEAERAFWWHVVEEIPPMAAPTGVVASIDQLGKANKIDGMRAYDFTNKNEFNSLATDWLANKSAASTFDKAVKELKTHVPADAAEVLGVNIIIKRDKAGRLSIKERD